MKKGTIRSRNNYVNPVVRDNNKQCDSSKLNYKCINAVGNVTAPQPANQTAERGENVSLALNKTANQTSEVGQNMSTLWAMLVNPQIKLYQNLALTHRLL